MKFTVTFRMNETPVYRARYQVSVETETRTTGIALATQILLSNVVGFDARNVEEITIIPDVKAEIVDEASAQE